MGWSEEVNGVCHDKDNWFFTQNGNLWKFPITHDLNKQVKWPYPKGILCHNTSKTHLGDFDYYGGYLFIPKTGKGKIDERYISSEVLKTIIEKNTDKYIRELDEPQIYVFRADNLEFVRTIRIKNFQDNRFSSLGWLAINPNNGLLYTSDTKVDIDSPVHIYSIGSLSEDDPLKFHSTLVLYDELMNVLNLKDMQGGCFDNSNYLHLSNGFVTNYKGRDPSKKNLDRFRTGISVFKVERNPAIADKGKAIRIVHSGQKNEGFRYQFDGTGDEPEGITYWDITNDPRVPNGKLRGHLHAIMLNNAGRNSDDFFFKHYQRQS